jgi:hypothetical protein
MGKSLKPNILEQDVVNNVKAKVDKRFKIAHHVKEKELSSR